MADIIPAYSAQYFEAPELIEPASKNKRKFSLSTLASCSSRSFSASDSSSASSVSQHCPTTYTEISEALYSKETYEFMGLTGEVASKVWERWNSHHPDTPDSFLQFALYHVEWNNEPDVYTEYDDWDACMEHMGVTKTCRDAILMPEYEDLRYTQSAKYWVVDTFEMRFGSLEHLSERLLSNLQIKQRIPDHSFSRGSSPPPSSPNPIPLPASSYSYASDKASKPKQGKSRQKGSEKSAKAEPETEVAALSSIPAGFTTIWKALDKRRCFGFLDPATGCIDLDCIASPPPTDFNGTAAAIYFTPQKSVADRYASWAKHRAECAEVMLIQIDVPFDLIEGKLGSNDFVRRIWMDSNPDCEWNQLVYNSRSRRRNQRTLAHLQKYGMLIGHISTGRSSSIARLPHHSSITDRHLLKVYDNGSLITGIQWAIHTDAGKEAFEKKCRGHAQLWSEGQLVVPKLDCWNTA